MTETYYCDHCDTRLQWVSTDDEYRCPNMGCIRE